MHWVWVGGPSAAHSGTERRPSGGGKTERIPYLETVTRATFRLVLDAADELSRGGMRSKLKAAQSVARTGAAVVIADGRMSRVVERVMACEDVGTLILPSV